eukprot:jgi/Ulvmu1/1815/UM119_0033.1
MATLTPLTSSQYYRVFGTMVIPACFTSPAGVMWAARSFGMHTSRQYVHGRPSMCAADLRRSRIAKLINASFQNTSNASAEEMLACNVWQLVDSIPQQTRSTANMTF